MASRTRQLSIMSAKDVLAKPASTARILITTINSMAVNPQSWWQCLADGMRLSNGMAGLAGYVGQAAPCWTWTMRPPMLAQTRMAALSVPDLPSG